MTNVSQAYLFKRVTKEKWNGEIIWKLSKRGEERERLREEEEENKEWEINREELRKVKLEFDGWRKPSVCPWPSTIVKKTKPFLFFIE